MTPQRAPHVISEHFQLPASHVHVLQSRVILLPGLKILSRNRHGHDSGWMHLPSY